MRGVSSKEGVTQKLLSKKIVAIIRADSATQAISFAKAAYQGGICAIEMTATTPDYIQALIDIKRECPHIVLGLGTVFDKKVAKRVLKKTAVDFIVSPCYVKEVAAVCHKKKVLYIPGCMSVKEIFDATKKFYHPIIKLFPSDLITPRFISSVKGLMPTLFFMPTGGVNQSQFNSWFNAGASIVAVGGNLTKSKEFSQIQKEASEMVSVIEQLP